MTYPKKLIEVALPLEAINKEAAREKSIRHGHPSTLHLWWARRPLAACRAVLFASLVDDPSEYIEGEEKQNEERQRLFGLIEDLVQWENINNSELFDRAKLEIAKSVSRNLKLPMPIGQSAINEFLATKVPPVLDPFAGGGSIPLEAQRLGLRTYASDLNPVAVLINKALVEIPPKFANLPPVHATKDADKGDQSNMFADREWKGAQGLAEDIKFYGQFVHDEAKKRIGHLYPKVKITKEILVSRPDLKDHGINTGDELTVIAWLWTRTVRCPNPACKSEAPLIRSFSLSQKKGKETYVAPIVDYSTNPKKINFEVRKGRGGAEGTVTRQGAKCIVCDSPIPFDYVRDEGQQGKLGLRMWAIVAEGKNGRIYLNPIKEHEIEAHINEPIDCLDTELPERALGFRVQLYGMRKHRELFTARQLVGLYTFAELIDNLGAANIPEMDEYPNYLDAIALYLALALDRLSQQFSTLSPWSSNPDHELVVNMFSRQTIQMVWDFGEINPFCEAASWNKCVDFVAKVIKKFEIKPTALAQVTQVDAVSNETYYSVPSLVSTDPPYYDNIGYADLSDYFYVWLRISIGKRFPDLFSTVLVPKEQELIATPFRFDGNRLAAKRFFEKGIKQVFTKFASAQDDNFPLSIFYAFKQSETSEGQSDERAIGSTGWETMLEGLLSSGLSITGTWPMRTEKPGRMIAQNTNALASSIVLICRKRKENASTISRREFLSQLKNLLPPNIELLKQGNIAPVDLAQAAIGPGMSVFSRYVGVLEADGSKMKVRTALGLINQVLDEYLSEQVGDYDADTRWALTWFDQYGFTKAEFDEADKLSKAKITSVEGLARAGIILSRAGKVRLLGQGDLDPDWSPLLDKRPTVWEACHYLIRSIDKDGEDAAADLLAKLGARAEPAKDLAYRLYTICERRGWTQEALGYNMLVVTWPRLKELVSKSTAAPQLL